MIVNSIDFTHSSMSKQDKLSSLLGFISDARSSLSTLKKNKLMLNLEYVHSTAEIHLTKEFEVIAYMFRGEGIVSMRSEPHTPALNRFIIETTDIAFLKSANFTLE